MRLDDIFPVFCVIFVRMDLCFLPVYLCFLPVDAIF